MKSLPRDWVGSRRGDRTQFSVNHESWKGNTAQDIVDAMGEAGVIFDPNQLPKRSPFQLQNSSLRFIKRRRRKFTKLEQLLMARVLELEKDMKFRPQQCPSKRGRKRLQPVTICQENDQTFADRHRKRRAVAIAAGAVKCAAQGSMTRAAEVLEQVGHQLGIRSTVSDAHMRQVESTASFLEKIGTVPQTPSIKDLTLGVLTANVVP